MTTTIPQNPAKPSIKARMPTNWPLVVGMVLVLGIVALAVAGPTIAPRDPLEDNLLIQDSTGEWHIPPFPAFEVEGFPLGSDEFGRDIYSRILYAIRPTLNMVAIVATVRLVLGTLMGLAAGWSTGGFGRVLDNLIGGALSLPGLMVALGAIAVIGPELGLISFVIGLSLTGWAETARLVREQTRAIKGELYVEAARAIGSTDPQIVFSHVLRQVAAMIWMLFAFEISSTLMLTAGLGFLGYYIGGDVWVDVADFVARRTSGAPELGQMLATAWVRLTDPWGLVSVGSVVFVTVLGFNLIGEGFRLRVSPEASVRRGRLWTKITEQVGFWFENYISYPLSEFFNAHRWVYGMTMLLVGLLIGGYTVNWYRANPIVVNDQITMLFGNDTADTDDSSATTVTTTDAGTIDDSSDSATTTTDIDAGSAETVSAETMPVEPKVLWQFKAANAFRGGPAVSADGTIYANDADGFVYALNPDGTTKWELALPERAIDTPAIGEDGTVYVTDKAGSLHAFSPAGEALWSHMLDIRQAATSSPVIGPDGTLYYATGATTGAVQAVAPDGQAIWSAPVETFSFFQPPIVSPAGDFVFLGEEIVNAADGSLVAVDLPFSIHRHVVATDGTLFLRSGHTAMTWDLVDGAPVIDESYTWPFQDFVSEETLPLDTGITAAGISWELYSFEFGGFTGIHFIKFTEDGGELLGSAGAELDLAEVTWINEETLEVVLCGRTGLYVGGGEAHATCHLVSPDSHETLWSVRLEEVGDLRGAAYENGLLYITTDAGALFVVDPTPEPAAGTAADFSLPTEPVQITNPIPVWAFEDQRFAGPPAATPEGTVFLASKSGTVTALGQDGTVLWQTQIDPPPAFNPTLGPDGNLYVPDQAGGLATLSQSGDLLGQFEQAKTGLEPSGSAVLSSNGNIYLALTNGSAGFVQAVSPAAESLWLTEAATFRFHDTPVLSAAEDLVFLAGDAFDAATGAPLDLGYLDFDIDQFITGENGRNYLRSTNTLFEWQRAGDQIEILETIEWTFRPQVLLGNISAPFDVRVAADDVITIFYNGTVLRIDQTGEFIHSASGRGSSHVLLMEADSSLITCGIIRPTPQDDTREFCDGFSLDDNGALWTNWFGRFSNYSDSIAGGARIPSGYVFVSEAGTVYGVMEESLASAYTAAKEAAALAAEQAAEMPLEGIETSATGSGWVFDVPEEILIPPLVHSDGSVYVLTQDFNLYVINADGSAKTTIPLETPPHMVVQSFFGGGRVDNPIWPVLAPDGSIMIAGSEQVYALNLDGTVKWAFALDVPPYNTFRIRGDNVYFLVDRLGSMYAISPANGLLWKHDLEEGLKAASAPVFGSEGNIYYTITNGANAKIEALSPEGAPLWRVDLTTFSFYDRLLISPTGAWMAVDNNVVNASTGTLVQIPDLAFTIEQMVMGQDGRTYLLSGATVMEWEINDAGQFEILNQTTINFPDTASRGVPPFMTVSEDGVYWLRLFTTGGRTYNMWVQQDGTVSGLIEVINRDDLVLNADINNTRLSICTPNRDAVMLACRGYEIGSNDPVWALNIQGIGEADAVFYQNGVLYVQVDEDTVQTVEVELP